MIRPLAIRTYATATWSLARNVRCRQLNTIDLSRFLRGVREFSTDGNLAYYSRQVRLVLDKPLDKTQKRRYSFSRSANESKQELVT